MKVRSIHHRQSLPTDTSQSMIIVAPDSLVAKGNEIEVSGGLTMYSQKSELGKVMIAWKEYGPDP